MVVTDVKMYSVAIKIDHRNINQSIFDVNTQINWLETV